MSHTTIPQDPHEEIGFEITPHEPSWTFAPQYYPDSFRQTKGRELERNPRQCLGETVTIKKIENREFHVKGVVLSFEVKWFQSLMDYQGKVDLLSPITKSGGMECVVKDSELGEIEGYDPHHRQWKFEYTVDLLSTGRDEYSTSENAIVTEILKNTNQ